MSNRPNPARSRSRVTTSRATTTTPGRSRVLITAGAVTALVVVLGLVIALSGGSDTAPRDDRPAYGPVVVDGSPLPRFASNEADAAVGQVAPRLEGTDPLGAAVSVGGRAASGEPTLIVFVAHWCPVCQAEVPVLVDLMASGDLAGAGVVGVLTGTDPARPNFPPVAWLEREGWRGDILLDDDTDLAAQSYGLSAYPFLVVLDSEGAIAARATGRMSAADVAALVASAG